MRRFSLASAAFLLLVGAAPEQGPIAMKAGETVTLLIDDGGRVVVEARGKAKLTRFDKASADHLVRMGNAYPVGATAAPLMPGTPGVPEPKPVARAAIVVKFADYPAGHRMLFIENGYDRALAYRARILRGDKWTVTDVCTVMPLKRGQEHWPYAIDTIELSGMKLVPWKESDGVTCE